MIDVILQTHDRNARILRHFAEILVADAVEAIADRDAVTVPGQHLARVLRRFAVGNLHLVGREIVRVAAELRHRGFRRVARARALLEKHHEQRLVLQQPVRLAQRKPALQVARHIQHGFQFFLRPVRRLDVVLASQQRLHDECGLLVGLIPRKK